MKRLLTVIAAGCVLLFGTAAFALTLDEAKTGIDKQSTAKKLSAQEHSQAVSTLQGLVEKGVPVDHAYRVVDAAINQGLKGKDLAEVARSIETAAPGARKDAAAVAADAIRHRYTAHETVQMTSTFGRTVASGAPADRTAEAMSHGITRGVGAGGITAAMNTYAGEIKSGTAPDRAAENATRTMDRDRTMEHDRNMSQDHDRMGSGSGMDHGAGMGPGAGAGPGMGGMGGPKR